MKQLDIENIELTENMFNILQNEFKDYSNKEYIECFKIVSEENLFNGKCINFYYILFKYVFKKPFYIYKIIFFLDAQESIKNIIKNDGKALSKKELNENDEKRYYILNIFLGSDYDFILLNKRESNLKQWKYRNKKQEIHLKAQRDKKVKNENEEDKILNKILNNKIKLQVQDKEITIELNNYDKYFYSQSFFNTCKNYFSNNKKCDGYIIFEFLTDFLDRLKKECKNNSKLIIEMNIYKIGNDFEFIYNFNSHFYKDVNNISEETFGYFIDEINCQK